MTNTDFTSMASTVAQGGVTVTALAFFKATLIKMIPYAVVAVPLIILDLVWGIRAARYRGERVTFSRGFRKTLGKIIEYICWIVVATSIGLAFDASWTEWAILGAVMFNELVSIVCNRFETKGVKISVANLWRWLIRFGASKVGAEVSKEDSESIILEQPRDTKGRFTAKKY